jgi:hypothetical protein
VNAHIYVELIAPRDQLESFMTQIAPLIASRSVTYCEGEDWTQAPADETTPIMVP